MKKSYQVGPLTQAQSELVSEHYEWAMNLGRKFAGLGLYKGIPPEDLQQEACYGLCIAAQRYRSDGGASFATYAYDWCRKYIMMAIDHEPFFDCEDISLDEYNELRAGIDIICDDNAADEERIVWVSSLLGRLSEQERTVICLIFGLSYCTLVKDARARNFHEVAELLHLGSARVHEIYERAMSKMEEKDPLPLG